MDAFLESLRSADGTLLWGIPSWRLGAALGLVFLGFAARPVLLGTFRFAGRRARGTRIRWDDEAAELLPKPLAVAAQILLWRAATALLLLPQEPLDLRRVVAQGLDAALLVALVWVLFRVVDVGSRSAQRWTAGTDTRIDDQAIPLIRKTLKVFLALLGAVFVIQNLGYSVTSVVAGLGIGGLALALAAQDSVANFFGSVVLFTDAPFQVGDYVEVGGVSGTVEEVGFRTTRIRQIDSSLVSIPNKTFTGSVITNYSARTGRLIAFDFGLVPDAHADRLDTFVDAARDAFLRSDNVRADSVEVHLSGVGPEGVGVRARAFTRDLAWSAFLETREAVLLQVLRALEEEDLQLARPVPSVTVTTG